MNPTPHEIWTRYEANIDRVRANLSADDATAYHEAIRWLFDNPIGAWSSDQTHLKSLRLLRAVSKIEREAAAKRLVVGTCFSWPAEIGGEG